MTRYPALAALGLLLLASAPAPAQEQVGPGRCVNCHASLAKTSWEQKHKRSAKQLDDPKAAAFAAAVGGNAHAPRCTGCHAPTTAGSEKGVSCESCHGPGSAYRAPHQQPAFYQQPESQWLGLANLRGNAERIARLCVDCHVLDPGKDAAIAAAGHPTGAAFATLGRKLDEMKHWPSRDPDAPLSRPRAYDAAFLARVTSAAGGLVAPRLARLPKAGAPAAASAAATVPRAPKPAAPSDDPFFADEVPEYVPGSATAPESPTTTRVRTIAPDPPAVEIPRAPVAEPTPDPAAVAMPAPPSAGGSVSARLAPRDMAELRGRAVRATQQLLKDAAGTLTVPPPSPPGSWTGPDGELLRLQDEALALALEALRRP